MSFGQRMLKILDEKDWSQADLCKATGFKSGLISQLATDPNRDPRVSTAAAIAKALDVSLDYLAGLTDNPSGFTQEELEQLRIDSDMKTLLKKYVELPLERKEIIQETVDFQLSKSKAEGTSERVDYAQIIGVA